MYNCTACGFKTPTDTIGANLMQAHLESDHNVEPKRVTPMSLSERAYQQRQHEIWWAREQEYMFGGGE